MKKRFSNEVIDLFEALAPSDEEILSELCGPREISTSLNLTPDGHQSQSAVNRNPSVLGGHQEATLATPAKEAGTHSQAHPNASSMVEQARSVISKLLYALAKVPPPLDVVGAAAAHVPPPANDQLRSETIALRWQQGDEAYELYYLEPDRNKAYVRSIHMPAAALSATELSIDDRKFVLSKDGDQAYVRWPLTALVGYCSSKADDETVRDTKVFLWIL